MRRRKVFSKREILASDINEVNDNIIANETTIIKDLMAVSSGVVSGLNITYSILDFTVVKGTYCDGEVFYELLNDLTDSLPIAGTYKIYITLGSTDDTPTSGYVLIDTLLRVESYDIVNNRTYDSITVGKTTGSIPMGSIQIGTLVSDGINITSYTDERIFVTFGNLTAYSLQNFSENSKSTASRASKISGIIIDETDPIHNVWSKVTINNAHAGYGFQTVTGTNSGAIGFLANINNNIGFKSISSGTNSIGFNSVIGATNKSFYGLSTSKTATIGLELDGYLTGVNLVNSTYGLTITGSNIDINEYGINLLDNYNSLYIENTNFLASGQYLSKMVANADITGGLTGKYVSLIETNGAMTGQKISSFGNSDFSFGSIYENSTLTGTWTGIAFKQIGSNPSININMENPYGLGLSISQSTNLSNAIFVSNINSSSTYDLNKAIYLELNHNVTGIHINKASSTSTLSYGMIIGALTGSTNKFETSLFIRNSQSIAIGIDKHVNDAIFIDGDNSALQYGVRIKNNKFSLKIEAPNNQSGGIGINIIGKDRTTSSIDGIYISKTNTAIDMSDNAYGIKIQQYSSNAIKIFNAISSFGYAIDIDGIYGGIAVNNSSSDSYALRVDYTCPHQILLKPLSAVPSGGTVVDGAMAMVNDGSGAKLRIYDGTWKTVTMV